MSRYEKFIDGDTAVMPSELLRELVAENAELRAWRRVEDELPESGQYVIAYFKNSMGKPRPIRAVYARERDLLCVDEFSADFGEYDETTDEYYCPEGWYETNEFEEVHWAVDDTITHWMPLPEPPSAAMNPPREGDEGDE